MTITALPPAPQPSDTTEDFNSKAFTFVGALPTFVTETNAVAADVSDFGKKYLGSKVTNPTLDNEGAALQPGMLYWNSVANEMRAYDGAAWVTAYVYDADLNTWASKTPPTGAAVGTTDTQTLSNKTFGNNTTFHTGAATQDGVVLAGRAGGSSSFRVTLQPAVLTASRNLTLPNASGTVVTTVGADGLFTGWMLQDVGWDYFDSTTTNALNFVNGSHQRWAPNTGAQTLSITNWPPSGALGELLIEGVNLGAATITWPTINWINPDGTTTTTISTYLTNISRSLRASGADFVFLWTRDAGTTIYGKLV